MNSNLIYLEEIEKSLQAKDKEIERLNNIIKNIKQRILDTNKPLPSGLEILEILKGEDNE